MARLAPAPARPGEKGASVTDERAKLAKGRRRKAWRRAFALAVPEPVLFVRHPDGRARQVTLSRPLMLAGGVAMALLLLWTVAASALLLHRPASLAARERHLEELLEANRSAQQRLAASQQMVADLAREVDLVQSNLLALAESSAALVKDRPAPRPAPPRPSASSRADPAELGDEGRAVRDQIRRLETSLDRLRLAYAQVVETTSAAAAQRILDAERSLGRLGIDPGAALDRQQHAAGRGGPLVPVSADSAAVVSEASLSSLNDRLDRWSGMVAMMRKMPLGEPLHVAYDVSSGFGTRNDPLNRRTRVHEGVDLTAAYGSPVYATGDGRVEFAGPWDRYGLAIEIDHGGGVATRYAHLSRILVREGQAVTRQTVIGLLGNTGRSTGPHLHYEVRLSESPRDPLKFIAAGEHVSKAW